MAVSSVGSSTAAYSTTSGATSENSSTAATQAASADASTTRASTTVTLGDGTVSEVSVYSGTLKSMPISVAMAPELFAEADKDQDNTVSLKEFTEQLKRVGVSSDAAAQLFDSINPSKGDNLSIDDFVKGVVATNAKGNSVFQDLYTSYTSDQDGKPSTEAYDSFMAQGASVAAKYWMLHPELQQRS